VPHVPNCGKIISANTIDQIVEQVKKLAKNSEVLILGPVYIRAKQGANTGQFLKKSRKGVCARQVDGKIYLIEEALDLQLDINRKAQHWVVVDRLKMIRILERSRLVDSLGNSLKVGKGIVIIGQNDKDDLTFSEHFACEDCGISMPELEPRLFSFNNPYGACPECTGLGEKLEVDPELVIPNKNLTLAEGAIWPWSRASHKVGRQGYYYSLLASLAAKHNFSLDEEVKNLPQRVIDIILRR
jgi:excinuclease ABC subunit A